MLLIPRSVQLRQRRQHIAPATETQFTNEAITSKRKSQSVLDEQEQYVSKRVRKTVPSILDDSSSFYLDSHLTSPDSTDDITKTRDIASTEINVVSKTEIVETASEDEEGEEEAPVKEFAYYQRPALPGEPVCIVCGRYGEYISDATDHDVCSRECKAIDMQRTQAEKQRLTSAPDTNTTIAPAPRHAPVYYPIERFHAHLTVYQPHPDVARLNMVELEALRMMHQIKVRGRHVPPPLTDFSQIPMPNRLYERLTTLYSNTPTPVQMQVIPAALTARDLIVAAPTGSGKTLAFLLPCIIHACALSNAFGTRGQPYVLVVGPTHDLCAQLQAKAQALCQGLPNMRTALLTGKTPLPPQLYRLEHGAALAFGTPGRLLRILNTLPQTDWPRWDIIILDEVDHLVYSKTSEEDIKLLLSKLISVEKDVHDQRLASAKQLMVFSATRAWRTRRLFKTWMNDVIRIAIGDLDIIAPDVRQTFYWVENQSKKRQLFRLLDAPDRYPTPAIIFVMSRLGAKLLAEAISKRYPHLRTTFIHGEMSGPERDRVRLACQQQEVDVVVATGGLWSRGMDFPHIRLVINFDMPTQVSEYIHQAGRASRLDVAGHVISFINDDSKSMFQELLEMLREVPRSKLDPLPEQLRKYYVDPHSTNDINKLLSRLNQPRSAFRFVPPSDTSTTRRTTKRQTPAKTQRKRRPRRRRHQSWSN